MIHDIWEANLCVWGLAPMPTPVHASVEDIAKIFGDGDGGGRPPLSPPVNPPLNRIYRQKSFGVSNQ